MLVRTFTVMTAAAVTSSLLFNFMTNGNSQLMFERFRGVLEDPAILGALLALIYTVASFAQIVVGHLIDRMPFKPLQFWMSFSSGCRWPRSRRSFSPHTPSRGGCSARC
jgi:hypothetical protein